MRLTRWRHLLAEYLQSVQNSPFAYGSFDCGLLASGAIAAMTGTDPAARLRGRYTSRLQAFRAIKRICGSPWLDDLARHAADRNGWPEIPLSRALVGDLVVMGTARTARLGIISMHGTEVIAPGDTGTILVPLNQVTRVWSI